MALDFNPGREWDACDGGPDPEKSCYATEETSKERGATHCTCWYDELNYDVDGACCYCGSSERSNKMVDA